MPEGPATGARPARSARERLIEWGRRYAPLEIAATATALIGGLLASGVTANGVAIAYAGAWAENVGYYGVAFVREMRRGTAIAAGSAEGAGRLYYRRAMVAIRGLLWEFGVAEMIDSFVSRPFCMYWGTVLTGHLGYGIVLGKLAADVIFYGIAIVFYEWGKYRKAQ
jgi:hypothetical protein